MTGVYSGGLVYEYTMEPNKYGIVQVDSDTSVTELDGYSVLKSQFAANPPPTGDGGYNPDHAASECPEFGPNWNVTDNTLPLIPEKAAKMMEDGAGEGVGLTGSGSQNAGETSTGTATPGSGSVTATASRGSSASGTGSASASASQGAASGQLAPFSQTPLIMGSAVFALTALGALLL